MFSGMVQVSNQALLDTNTSRDGMVLGTLGVSRGGDLYRFALNGAVALAAGLATIAAAKVSNHTNLSLDSTSNTAVGSNVITVDLAGTALTQDQYLDGFANINDGAGVGQRIRIVGNQAQTSTTGAAQIFLETPVQIALNTGTTKVSLEQNPYANTIVHPGSASTFLCTGVPQGITPAAGVYYWSKTRGGASVLSDGVIAKGTGAILTANAIAGALTTEAAATVVQRVGVAPEATVDTKHYTVKMLVD